MLKEYLVWAHKEVWALEENDETGKSFMTFEHFHKVVIANAVAMRRKLTEFKQSIFLNISFFCLQGETNKKKTCKQTNKHIAEILVALDWVTIAHLLRILMCEVQNIINGPFNTLTGVMALHFTY